MATNGNDEPNDNDAGGGDKLKPGYRAFLVKDGDKYYVTLPVAEYDPEAPSLTRSQIEGLREIAELFHQHGLVKVDAKVIRFDPFNSAQHTGGGKPPGGGGPSLTINLAPDGSTD